MRRILTSVVLLVLLFPSLASGETLYDLIINNGLYYKPFTTVPFTGTLTSGNPADPTDKGNIKDGKKEGPWVGHTYSGHLRYRGNYKDGKKNGPWVEYHEVTARLWYRGTYKDGIKVGPWVYYNLNGQLVSEGTYKNGKKDGPWIEFNTITGHILFEETGTFRDGKKVK